MDGFVALTGVNPPQISNRIIRILKIMLIKTCKFYDDVLDISIFN